MISCSCSFPARSLTIIPVYGLTIKSFLEAPLNSPTIGFSKPFDNKQTFPETMLSAQNLIIKLETIVSKYGVEAPPNSPTFGPFGSYDCEQSDHARLLFTRDVTAGLQACASYSDYMAPACRIEDCMVFASNEWEDDDVPTTSSRLRRQLRSVNLAALAREANYDGTEHDCASDSIQKNTPTWKSCDSSPPLYGFEDTDSDVGGDETGSGDSDVIGSPRRFAKFFL